MKILFFHIPNLGMYHAIEPILLKLQERGHQVVHYNEPGFRQYVQNAPFSFIAYSNYEGYFPNRFHASMNLYELGLLLLETAEHTVDFVEAEVLRESPDLILHSKFTAAPKIVAKKHGIPAACLTNGFVLDPRTILDAERKKRSPVDMSNVSSFLRFQKRANRFYGQHLNGTILAPLPKLGDKIAMGVWTTSSPTSPNTGTAYLAKCTSFDEAGFAAFFDAYQFKGPERFPANTLTPGT